MEEARTVLDRLERIEALDRERADASLVLAELRELVVEVEAWVRRESNDIRHLTRPSPFAARVAVPSKE